MIRRMSVLLTVFGSLALYGQVSESAPVIEASGLSITKAEFEQMLKGDPRYQAAFAQPATKRALGVDSPTWPCSARHPRAISNTDNRRIMQSPHNYKRMAGNPGCRPFPNILKTADASCSSGT